LLELLRALFPPQQYEIPGPSVPDWIVAGTSIATVLAAGGAGWYARQAAIWTGRQAASAAEQVTLAQDALTEAKTQTTTAQAMADLEREEVRRSRRRLEEARYDAAMPSLRVWATPGIHGDHGTSMSPDGGKRWATIDRELTVTRPRDDLLFRRGVTVHLRNYSNQLAKVSIVEVGAGEASISQGNVLVIEPGATEIFTWTHVVAMHQLTPDSLQDPELGLGGVRMTLWVRDNALTSYDVMKLNIGFSAFRFKDSTLIVEPPSKAARGGIDWGGWLLDGRVYEALDARAKADDEVHETVAGDGSTATT